MDSLPDEVVQYILSKLSNAKDLALGNCVSNKWKHLMTCHKSLFFSRYIFDKLTGCQTPDSIVTKMVSAVSRLEELELSFSFTSARLASLLLTVGSSLRSLELNLPYDLDRSEDSWPKLESIQAARNLESLRLSNLMIEPTPKWDVFQKLRNLQITSGKLDDSVLREVLRVTPNLTRLVLMSCKGLSTVCIELPELRHCELYVYLWDSCSLTLKAPKIEYLVVEDCDWIRVHETNCLKNLSISLVHTRELSMVDFSNLMALESLNVSGSHYRWDVLSKMLKLASEVKHLCIKIDYTGLYGQYLRFPDIDFVDFFTSHSKLESFNICDAMFEALCIKNMDSSFVIPCLEEAVITKKLRSKTTSTFESLLKYGNKLKKIKILLTQFHDADGFFEDFRTSVLASSSRSTTRLRVLRHSTTELHLIRRRRK